MEEEQGNFLLTGQEASYTFLFMVIHPAIRSLIDEIDAFRTKAGMSVTAFGTLSLGDSNFIPDLHRGRMPSLATMDRVRAFIRHREERLSA